MRTLGATTQAQSISFPRNRCTAPPRLFAFVSGRVPLCWGAHEPEFRNSTRRVVRRALLLHVVPNEVMGRVGGFYQVLDRVLRTVLVMAMAVIDTHGPPASYMVLTAVLLVALFGVLQSRNSVRASVSIVPAIA